MGLLVAVAALAIGYWWHISRPESCYERGRAALADGDDETVIREADRLMQIPEFEAKGRLLKGLLAVRRNKLTEALEQLSQAGSTSTNVEADAAAAQCFYRLGRFIDAIEVAHVALALDSHCVDARRWLASAYYDLGAMPNAVTELKQISQEVPSDPRPDRLLGLIAKDNENFIVAVGHYRESLKRDPHQIDHQTVVMELAESLIKLGEFDEAIVALQKGQRSAAILTLQAEAKRGLGQVQDAENLLNEATKLDSHYFPALLERGKLLLDLLRIDEAIAVLGEALKIEPMNRVAHLQLSQALRQAGKPEQADAELTRMQEVLALEREFTDLHESAAKYPEDFDIRLRLADVAQKLGKPELAAMWVRAARSLNPTDPRVPSEIGHGNLPARSR